jgi:hypothetical protein
LCIGGGKVERKHPACPWPIFINPAALFGNKGTVESLGVHQKLNDGNISHLGEKTPSVSCKKLGRSDPKGLPEPQRIIGGEVDVYIFAALGKTWQSVMTGKIKWTGFG